MRLPALLLLLAPLFTACRDVRRSVPNSQAQDAAPRQSPLTSAAAGTSTFTAEPDSAGLKRYRIVNQRFVIAEARGASLLLRETSDQHCCLGGERNTWGTIGLEALADSSSKNVLWHVLLKADRGELWGPFYRASWMAVVTPRTN